jgi:hypothetical protein
MYRRFIGTETWHSNAGCVAWPLLNFEEKPQPASETVCSECLELEQMVAGLPPADLSQLESAETSPS